LRGQDRNFFGQSFLLSSNMNHSLHDLLLPHKNTKKRNKRNIS